MDENFLKEFLNAEFEDLVFKAWGITRIYKGKRIELCAIINAKSGACPGDCKFCAQSSRYDTQTEVYPLLSVEEVLSKAKLAKENCVKRFSIVTSGIRLSKGDLKKVAKIIETLAKNEISVCASMGLLKKEELAYLRDFGLTRYHCNLETSERYFPKICTTHTFRDKLQTLEAAKSVGLSICSGGIFGIGETWEDRLYLALTLKNLEVDSIPVNFLIPIKGTPLENRSLLSPIEALKIVVLFRLILVDKDIRIAGGRLQVLKEFSSWIFLAGANALMTGNYLTTSGNPFERDLEFVKNHGLEVTL